MQKPVQKILLATDFSEASHNAARKAIELAHSQGAALTLLHVFDTTKWLMPVPFFSIPNASQWAQEHMDVAQVKAHRLLQDLNELYGGNAQVLLLEGNPEKVIVETAEVQGSELIVVGSHGHTGLQHALLGSVASYVARRAHCSVLTVKATPPQEAREQSERAGWDIRRILVPVDFSQRSKDALKEGIALAHDNGATLQLLHTIAHLYEPSVYEQYTNLAMGADPRPEIERHTRETLKGWVESLSPEEFVYSVEVTMGSAADRISHYAEAEESDLIVMSTHGYTGLKRFFLGSVAEQVLRYAPCPVLILRHPRESL